MRHDELMILEWQVCKAFNNKYPIGSKIVRIDPETEVKTVIETTSEAHVINDNAVVACENKVYKLIQLIY